MVFGTIIGGEGLKSNDYNYDDQGRPITPSQEGLNTLPSNGGELWNRLVFEGSPYLLQHAANPVDCIHGAKRLFKKQKNWINPFFFLSVILPVTGAMSWNMNRSRMRKLLF